MDANGKTSSARSRALSTLGEKYQILPYMGFAFLYAWVQMTFHSEAWIDWGQHGSAAAQWLFPLTNIPFVIIGIVGARWQLVIYRALFKRASVATVILLGTGGSLLMVAGLLSSSDACFIVGCLIADSGTAFATLGLSALYAEQGPHRTVVLVSMGIGLGSLFWFMATSLPFYLAAAIYGCLPLFAMLCLLTRAGSFQREAADIVSGPSSIASLPQDLGRLMGMLALFSAIAGIAVPLLGSAENPNSAQVMEFFVIGACGVLICLCAREYGMRTVENAYSFLALAMTILMLSAVMIHAENAAFWGIVAGTLSALADIFGWGLICAAAYESKGEKLRIMALGRIAVTFGQLCGWAFGLWLIQEVSIGHNLAPVGIALAALVMLSVLLVFNNHRLSALAGTALEKDLAQPDAPAHAYRDLRDSFLMKRCQDLAIEGELSPRELEVLGLLARGRSNVDIQDELFISSNTAKTHVSNIYRKLGVHNRSELFALIDSV